MLGGNKTQYEYNRNVWLIRCNSKANQQLSLNSKDVARRLVVEAEKLSTEGPEPVPRALQTAVFCEKYIVVFGGRGESAGRCLNDVTLLDLSVCRWQPVVVYGFHPSKRWGHVMGAEENAVLVLGGVGETTLASSTIHKLIMNRKAIKDNLMECKKIKTILEVEAKKVQLHL